MKEYDRQPSLQNDASKEYSLLGSIKRSNNNGKFSIGAIAGTGFREPGISHSPER